MPQWGPLFETGIPIVDEQHRELVRRLNDLGREMKRGRGGDVVAELLAYLERYAAVHFESEECLMGAADYPGLAEHRRRHAEFRRQLAAHLAALGDDPGGGAALRIHGWIMTWLGEHVLHADLKFADHVRERGLSAEPSARVPPRGGEPGAKRRAGRGERED
ncbi:MAG: bacteriohemerythrin [Deferrisomatales bacterium]